MSPTAIPNAMDTAASPKCTSLKAVDSSCPARITMREIQTYCVHAAAATRIQAALRVIAAHCRLRETRVGRAFDRRHRAGARTTLGGLEDPLARSDSSAGACLRRDQHRVGHGA